MRLEELAVIPYSLPFREPYVTARGELRERELVMVRIRGEGLEGLGETASLSLRGGPGVEAIAAEIRDACWPALMDGGLDPERIWSAIARCRNRGVSPEALAAVDVALHDLAAKAAGRPLWKLLGAESAAPVPCNATLPTANPTRLRELAEEWAGAGFETFKLKVGVPGDVVQVATVREALGAGARIRVDANAAWDLDTATERLRAISRHTIELAEEPVEGLRAMAELRTRTTVPLAADESVVAIRDAREAVELEACEMATVKLAKVGGIAAALEIAEVLPVYLSSALEGPVGIAAAAHTALALGAKASPEIAQGLATERLFAESVGEGVPLRGASCSPEMSPGSGFGSTTTLLRRGGSADLP